MKTESLFEDAGVEISHHWVAGEVYSKRTHIPAGTLLTQHVHPHDHASALVRGTVMLEVEGISREVTGPAMLMIEAGKAHSVTAITDVTWHCLWVTTFSDDPKKIDAAILRGTA